MKFDFFDRFFETPTNIKFHENPFSGSRVARGGRTDRHDEANSRFPQFCERVWKCEFPYKMNKRLNS
jgi:hypothetical protein